MAITGAPLAGSTYTHTPTPTHPHYEECDVFSAAEGGNIHALASLVKENEGLLHERDAYNRTPLLWVSYVCV